MTREEAKTNLDMIRVAFGVPVTKEQKEIVDETFEMAIQALSQEPCTDAVSRQAVLDAFADYVGSGMSMNDFDALWDIVVKIQPVDLQKPRFIAKSDGTIEQIKNGVFVGRWISVSERLPEDNGYYLTTTMYHEVYCDYWEEDRFNRTEAVIAWMPLPKPYEPQESEDKE